MLESVEYTQTAKHSKLKRQIWLKEQGTIWASRSDRSRPRFDCSRSTHVLIGTSVDTRASNRTGLPLWRVLIGKLKSYRWCNRRISTKHSHRWNEGIMQWTRRYSLINRRARMSSRVLQPLISLTVPLNCPCFSLARGLPFRKAGRGTSKPQM